MKIVHKHRPEQRGGDTILSYKDGSSLTIEGVRSGEVNYFWGAAGNLVWREKGGGWTFGKNDGHRYPCRLAAVAAYLFTKQES